MIIGITASAFDLLHVGHVMMLKEAKEHCDHLICCLHVDPSKERSEKNKPIQSVVERFMQLEGIMYVDEIVPYETEKDLLDIIQLKRPDVRIIGEEYKEQEYTGKYLTANTHYNRRGHRFSSSELRKRLRK
tara:strand:- start:509 stop:901 length:393 start_codon:yes stop_codon:yes gene_type:complete